MLLLILAHGDIVGLIEQDIRRHQRRIGEETAVDVLAVLGRLVLKLRHARELAEHRIAVQHPPKLCVLRHVGLDKERVLLGIEAAGNVLRELLERAATQRRRILTHGDRVHIGHEVVVVKFLVALRPVLDRAEVGPEGQIAAGLNAGQHHFLARRVFHVFHRFFSDLLFFSFYLELRRFGAAIDPICYVTIPSIKIQAWKRIFSLQKVQRPFVDFSAKIWCNNVSDFDFTSGGYLCPST